MSWTSVIQAYSKPWVWLHIAGLLSDASKQTNKEADGKTQTETLEMIPPSPVLVISQDKNVHP